MEKYDVIIIGAGPAGIFTAFELVKNNSSLKILMLEKGYGIEKRYCPIKEKETECKNCLVCSMVCGWGGAGAFSDGKLTLTSNYGGYLSEYIGKEKLEELIDYVDQVYLSYGASTVIYGEDQEVIKELQRQAARADLNFVPAPIRHLGTEKCYEILSRMQEDLKEKVTLRTLSPVKKILVNENNQAKGVETIDGDYYEADIVVSAPGREGSEWFYKESERLGLKGDSNPVDIGVRVELPAVIMEELTKKIYESKLIYYSKSFDDRVRTFCMNPYGEVVMENNSGLITVNGHSYADKKTENTNFALLVSKTFTEPFKDPITYGKYIASLANILGGGVLLQRLGDLLAGRRSTRERIKRGLVQPTLKEATPGDLSLVLPYRHLISILEMLEALDRMAPGVYSRHTLLYGVEVKFYSFRQQLSKALETNIENLFAIGDGAGVTRGLAQASVAGVLAAQEISKRLES